MDRREFLKFVVATGAVAALPGISLAEQRCNWAKDGLLRGIGTGNMSVTPGMKSVLHIQNGTDKHWLFDKFGFALHGNKPLRMTILYQTDIPTQNAIPIYGDNRVVASKWNGSGEGLLPKSGGVVMMPAHIQHGFTSIPLEDKIVLGPGDTMEFRINPQEDCVVSIGVVFIEHVCD